MRRHPMLMVVVLSLIATAIGIAVALVIDWFPTQASTASEPIDTLYDVLLIASVPIFVLVMAVVFYSVWAFRVKPGDMSDGAPIHGNTRLEIVWVTIPLILVSALAGYGWIVLVDIEAEEPNPLVVNVTGQQFAWSFEYPGEGRLKSNQLVLPLDRPVHFKIHSEDVLHDFWVPEFRLKTDAVPGITTDIRVTPNRLGTYPVVCAELCGIGHSTMRQTVRVVPQAEYDAWVAERRQSASDGGLAAADGDPQEAGRMLFADANCGACHTLADADASGASGPNLDDLAAQAAKLGDEQGQTPKEYVMASITDPDSFVVPGFQKGLMPDDFDGQFSPEELDTLVEYLLSVSKDSGSK
jgi:cytochrome c oxidase subunit 2